MLHRWGYGTDLCSRADMYSNLIATAGSSGTSSNFSTGSIGIGGDAATIGREGWIEVVAIMRGDEEEVVTESAGAPKPPAFAVFLFFFLLTKRPLAPLLVLTSITGAGAGTAMLLDPTSMILTGVLAIDSTGTTLGSTWTALDPSSIG